MASTHPERSPDGKKKQMTPDEPQGEEFPFYLARCAFTPGGREYSYLLHRACEADVGNFAVVEGPQGQGLKAVQITSIEPFGPGHQANFRLKVIAAVFDKARFDDWNTQAEKLP
jgi:hypothetical protein